MDLYIYYKVDAASAAALAVEVAALQARLFASHRVACVIRRRPGEQDGRQTWMEVYTDVPGGFDADLARAVAESGILKRISGSRHTEIFVEIQACA